MAWAKAPVALGAVTCAACLAIAGTMTSSVPAVQKAADDLAKTVQRGVHLTDFTEVDAFSALGLEDLTGYGLFDGLPALGNFANDGVKAFVPNPDGSPNYDALSGLNAYIGDGNPTTDIAAFNGLSNPGQVALSGIPALTEYAATRNTDAFRQTKTQAGYAALSALSDYRDGTLGNIDAFSGPGFYATALDPNETDANRADAIRSLDLISGVPGYLNLPTNPPADDSARVAAKVEPKALSLVQTPTPAQDNSANLVKTPVDNSQQQVQSTGAVAPVADPAPAAAPTPPASNNSGSSNKSGSYSGVFKPNNGVPILFGSGKGNGADNGIRGWGDMLKKAGLNGGESAGGGAAGGAPAGGGAAGGGTGGAGGGE